MQLILFAIADLVQGNLQMDSTPKLNMQQNVPCKRYFDVKWLHVLYAFSQYTVLHMDLSYSKAIRLSW